MNALEDAYWHADKAKYLMKHQGQEPLVHALLAIHNDLRLLIEFQEYRHG